MASWVTSILWVPLHSSDGTPVWMNWVVSVGTVTVKYGSPFCNLEFHANNQQCLCGYLSQGSQSFWQIPVWKSWLLFCGPWQHERQGTGRQNKKFIYDISISWGKWFGNLQWLKQSLSLTCLTWIFFSWQLVFNRTVTLKEDPGKIWLTELHFLLPMNQYTHFPNCLYYFMYNISKTQTGLVNIDSYHTTIIVHPCLWDNFWNTVNEISLGAVSSSTWVIFIIGCSNTTVFTLLNECNFDHCSTRTSHLLV